MTKEARISNVEMNHTRYNSVFRISGFGFLSSFVICHSSFVIWISSQGLPTEFLSRNAAAMSGGTLIALAADEIIMCEHAVLGPVDPQLGQYPAASICFPTRRYPFVQTVFQQHAGRKLAMQKSEDSNGPGGFGFRALDFFRHLAFVIRISSPGLPKSLASSCGAR